jgi:hypothetical protein
LEGMVDRSGLVLRGCRRGVAGRRVDTPRLLCVVMDCGVWLRPLCILGPLWWAVGRGRGVARGGGRLRGRCILGHILVARRRGGLAALGVR